MKKHELLEEALRVVKSRGLDYGKPENNFGRIASLWRVYVGNREGRDGSGDLNEADVCVMMILMKVARLMEKPDHLDSWIDIAGYAACGADVQHVEPAMSAAEVAAEAAKDISGSLAYQDGKLYAHKEVWSGGAPPTGDTKIPEDVKAPIGNDSPERRHTLLAVGAYVLYTGPRKDWAGKIGVVKGYGQGAAWVDVLFDGFDKLRHILPRNLMLLPEPSLTFAKGIREHAERAEAERDLLKAELARQYPEGTWVRVTSRASKQFGRKGKIELVQGKRITVRFPSSRKGKLGAGFTRMFEGQEIGRVD